MTETGFEPEKDRLMHWPGSPAGRSDATPATQSGRLGAESAWTWAGATFAVLACVALVVLRDAPVMGTLAVTFVSIVLEALPFVLLGSLVGGLIEVFVSRDRLTALLPRSRTLAIFVAGCLGIVFPVCECAIIPITRRLIRKGVPFSVAIGYLIAGPIVNPLVAASTAVAYYGEALIVFARLVCGFTIAVFIALVMDEVFPGTSALRKDATETLQHACEHEHGCRCGHGHEDRTHQPRSLYGRLTQAGEHAADDFLHVSQFLIIGAFVAALSQAIVARQAFVALANTPTAAIGLMMTLAVLLNLCSEADAFVAASFRTTLPLSAQLAFMVLGPMLDLKLIAMYLSFVHKRALALMIVIMVGLVFGMTVFLNFFGWSAL